MTDLAVADATEQAALVRSGAASPLELVDAAIERAEQCNPSLNAIIHPRFDRARADAVAAPDGPFRGVPIVVKDLDFDDTLECFPAGDFFVRAGSSGELSEMKFDSFVENFPHQGALAGAGNAGDAGPHAEGNLDVEVFQVVRSGAANRQPVGCR